MATPFTQNTGAAYQVSGSPSPQSKTLTGLSGSPGQAPVHYPAPQPTLSPLRASNTPCHLPSPALSEAPSVPPTQAGTHICNSYIPTIVLTHCARDLLWTSWPMPAPPPVFLFLPFHFPQYEHPSVSLACIPLPHRTALVHAAQNFAQALSSLQQLHTRALCSPEVHKCAPTQSYSNMHACAGPAAPLTLRTAGDTAQCSGTCLTWELSSPDHQEAPCPERRTQELNSLSPAPDSCQSYTSSGLEGRSGTRAVTDAPGLESSRTRDSGRAWPGLAPPPQDYLAP